MECRDCGSELPKGAYYCGGCGNPVGFAPQTSTMTDRAGLDGVPEPSAPVERAVAAEETPAGPARRLDRALCSLCMGAFPESVLSRIDGSAYCPDCSPLSARRSEPEPAPAPTPATSPGRTFQPARPLLYEEEAASSGGRKALAVVLVLLLLGAGGIAAYSFLGHSRIDKLMVGLDTGKRPAKRLYQKYSAGERLDYVLRARLDGKAKVSGVEVLLGGGDEMTFDLAFGSDISIDVLGVDSRGNADLEMGVSGLDLSGKLMLGDREMPLNQMGEGYLRTLEGTRMRSTVDPLGRPVGDPGPGAGPLGDLMNGSFGAMPDRPLAVGDEWNDSQTFGMPGGGGVGLDAIAIRATYRVEGYKSVRGRECMVISVEGEMGSNGGPGVLDMSMDMDMEGVIFFDVAAGQVEKVAMDMTLDFSAEAPSGSVTAEFKFEMDMDRR